MANIDLKNVYVEFPIYNVSSRSFKKRFIRAATGGHVVEDANQHIVINALKNATFSLRDGDRVGLVGHNGAGKSTLLRLLAQIYEPTHGSLRIDGYVSPLLNLMHSIEVEFTGYQNIAIRGTVLGLSKEEIQAKTKEIEEFTELGDYLSMPIRTYSSGMMVRLAFAISTSLKPDILLIDEVFGAGDKNFMLKARAKMTSLLKQSSIVVIASHSDLLIREFCNKAMLLEGGEIKHFGSIEETLDMYHALKR